MTMPASVVVLQDQTVVAASPALGGPSVVRVVIAGPQGPQGAPGPEGAPGKPEYAGQGPPGTIVGSKVGQKYLDEVTGEIYTLGG